MYKHWTDTTYVLGSPWSLGLYIHNEAYQILVCNILRICCGRQILSHKQFCNLNGSSPFSQVKLTTSTPPHPTPMSPVPITSPRGGVKVKVEYSIILYNMELVPARVDLQWIEWQYNGVHQNIVCKCVVYTCMYDMSWHPFLSVCMRWAYLTLCAQIHSLQLILMLDA